MFNLGDLVELIDGDLRGEVVAVEGSRLRILTEEDFSYVVLAKEVVICSDFRVTTHDMQHIKHEKETNYTKSKNPRKQLPKAILEIDLHIQNLVDNTRHMSNHEILNMQLKIAKNKLDYAIRCRISKVIFIHGVGEGILKCALQDYFRKQDYLSYHDASFSTYGRGATEVFIYLSKVDKTF